jgi:NitT/TauT family transport system substrate-binding protein
MFIRYRLRLFAVAAAFALANALPIYSAAQPAPALPVIRVGVGALDATTPMIYAVKQGLYRKYGLNVELVKLNNGPAIASAIAGGSLELGEAATLSVVVAVSKGLPFTVIGDLNDYDSTQPDQALLVPVNSAIKTPQDLAGKTLATVSLEGQPALGTFAWLDSIGIDRTAIKYVEIPASATLAAIEANRVDGAVFYEPFLSANMATGKLRVLAYPYNAIGKRYPKSVLFGNADWVGTHRDAVERFLNATQEASRYVGAHENDAAPLIADFAGLDVTTILNTRHGVRSVILPPGELQAVIDAAARYKFIPAVIPENQLICGCALRK